MLLTSYVTQNILTEKQIRHEGTNRSGRVQFVIKAQKQKFTTTNTLRFLFSQASCITPQSLTYSN